MVREGRPWQEAGFSSVMTTSGWPMSRLSLARVRPRACKSSRPVGKRYANGPRADARWRNPRHRPALLSDLRHRRGAFRSSS
jgi:hypothetical protein